MVGKQLKGLYKWNYRLWAIMGPGFGDIYIYSGTEVAAKAAAHKLAITLKWSFVPVVREVT